MSKNFKNICQKYNCTKTEILFLTKDNFVLEQGQIRKRIEETSEKKKIKWINMRLYQELPNSGFPLLQGDCSVIGVIPVPFWPRFPGGAKIVVLLDR